MLLRSAQALSASRWALSLFTSKSGPWLKRSCTATVRGCWRLLPPLPPPLLLLLAGSGQQPIANSTYQSVPSCLLLEAPVPTCVLLHIHTFAASCRLSPSVLFAENWCPCRLAGAQRPWQTLIQKYATDDGKDRSGAAESQHDEDMISNLKDTQGKAGVYAACVVANAL